MSEEKATPEEQVSPDGEATAPFPSSIQKLVDRFGDAILNMDDFRGDWSVVISREAVHDALRFLKEEPTLQYDHLSDLSAVDYLNDDMTRHEFGGARFMVVYHLYSHAHAGDPLLDRVRIKTPVPEEDPSVATASDLWTSANWAEREVWDMFGIRFAGHPDLRRILMPDAFEAHPLRKDYPLKGVGERQSFDFEQSPTKPVAQPEHLAATSEDRLDSETMVLNLGPQHPATHGTLHLEIELDGERIVRCTPHMGYLHTGFEKLGENLHYNQFIVVTDRMNYLSPLSNNFGYVLAVEKLLGLEVPKRAQYLRVALAELARIADHMVWLGTHALDIGAFTVFLYAFQQREKCYEIFEACSGARLTVSYTRVGGLMHDVPESFEPMMREFVGEFLAEALPEMERMLSKNRIWIDRTKGVGVISAQDAIDGGLTGPCLRGSGVEWDVRKVSPYSSYEEFEFDIPVGQNGDTYDRYLVRLEELRQSCRIILQALDNLPDGPVNSDDHKRKLPDKSHVYKTPDHTQPYDPHHPLGSIEGLIHHFKLVMDGHGIQAPRGEVYCATEAPNGELGFFIVSDGEGHPSRVRIRPPSFYHYANMPRLVTGHMVSDVVTVLGSLNVIAGELDR